MWNFFLPAFNPGLSTKFLRKLYNTIYAPTLNAIQIAQHTLRRLLSCVRFAQHTLVINALHVINTIFMISSIVWVKISRFSTSR